MKHPTLLLFLLTLPAFAETPGTVEAKASVGYTGFTDEAIINHLQTGASARIYLTRRFSVEPEFQYLRGSHGHYDVVVVPNMNWDFRPSGRVIPYLTGGVGWMHSRDRRFFDFSYNQAFFQVGAGVKLRLDSRWYLAPEFRAGSELHFRAGVALGYTFPR
jgi:hypothetical protein